MIWLVGGAGMLGTEVRMRLDAKGWSFFTTDLDCDISVHGEVAAVVAERQPTWIINCAAYTAVDRAEQEEERAFAVNAVGARHLAEAAHARGARLIHVSTDYVFSGQRPTPYPEDARPDPIGAYGRSKAAGERLVRKMCPGHFIIRTAWLHGPHGSSFVATMLRLMRGGQEVQVVDDQHGTPTYATDLARAALAFVHQDARAFGTYHFTNEGACTWFAFAKEIQAQARVLGLVRDSVPIAPIPTSAYPTPARRPANSVLSTERIRTTLGITAPSWENGLVRHLRRLQQAGLSSAEG